MEEMPTWANHHPSPPSLQIPTVRTGGTVLPDWRNGPCWAWNSSGSGWNFIITAQHRPTALQALPPPHLAGTQENLRMTWMASASSPGIRGKVGANPGGLKEKLWRNTKLTEWLPPSPEPPSHNWDFLFERLWFSSHLDLVWTCSMVYLVKVEILHEKWNYKYPASFYEFKEQV